MTITPQEIEEVTSQRVACNGGLETRSEGHPKVWLKLSIDTGAVTCPYCEKSFVLKKT
jgi:uncharacterized Zn-finger protein